jgi:glycosyltransferase involved in cell wall biosynthesis
MRISAVFPAHNEEANIEQAVTEMVDVLRHVCDGDEYEVIVVDDGSTDRTAEIVRKLHDENTSVRLVQHETNQGYGQAVKTGLQAGTLDYVFFTDSDLQFDVWELDRLLPFLDRADVVCGYRIDRQDPWNRRVIAKGWNYLVRVLFYVPVRDIDCAFKIFRREALQGLEIEAVGALINTELMVKLGRSGFGVAEVGVNHFPRVGGEQSGAKVSVILLAFRELLRMRRYLHNIDMQERHYARRRALRRGRPDA